MAQKSQTLVGLDIGTTNITVVIAQVNDGNVEIVGVGTSPSRGLRKGVVINIEATVESISRAVQTAETMAGIQVNSVYASISGSHIRGLNSNGIVPIKNREVSHYDIEEVIKAARAVAIPMDREILHVLPQEFIVDDQDGIKEPLGISGVRLEARVHIVTGAVTIAQNVVKCANRCGLTVKDIVLGAIASGKGVVSPEEQELGVCLVDIGGGTTDLTVFHGGAVKHTAVIPVGGSHLTGDIAAGLRTPIAAAESIKCRKGTALVNEANESDTIEVPSTGGRPPRVISKSVLAGIIEARVSEIFSLAQRELIKADCEEFLTSGLVLTGGTANLSGICEVAEGVFSLPVRVGSPVGVAGITDLVGKPEYATAVGLIKHGLHADTYSKRFKSGRGPVTRFFKKVGNWVGENF